MEEKDWSMDSLGPVPFNVRELLLLGFIRKFDGVRNVGLFAVCTFENCWANEIKLPRKFESLDL